MSGQIYLVTEGEYDDYRVHSAHTSRERAEQLAELLRHGGVLDIELDAVDFTAIDAGVRMWEVAVDEHGVTWERVGIPGGPPYAAFRKEVRGWDPDGTPIHAACVRLRMTAPSRDEVASAAAALWAKAVAAGLVEQSRTEVVSADLIDDEFVVRSRRPLSNAADRGATGPFGGLA